MMTRVDETFSASPSHPAVGHNGVVRVHLDAGTCQGHNRCRTLAPEVFDVDDVGQAVLRIDDEVPDRWVHRVRLAAANCPEYAIVLHED